MITPTEKMKREYREESKAIARSDRNVSIVLAILVAVMLACMFL